MNRTTSYYLAYRVRWIKFLESQKPLYKIFDILVEQRQKRSVNHRRNERYEAARQKIVMRHWRKIVTILIRAENRAGTTPQKTVDFLTSME